MHPVHGVVDFAVGPAQGVIGFHPNDSAIPPGTPTGSPHICTVNDCQDLVLESLVPF